MKREFKKGDRVLVRLHDLDEWKAKEFKSINLANPLYTFVDTDDDIWSQCRHIDDFRNGDKVQVRSRVTREWEDAIYAVYMPYDSFEHWVFTEDMDNCRSYKLCRWHPSMPWAEKEEPLTLEQRVEELERKLNQK